MNPINQSVLELLEQNINGLELLQHYIQNEWTGELHRELLSSLQTGRFDGCECLLPIILLSADNAVIEFAVHRLFLQLYGEKLREAGVQAMAGRVADLLREESARWDRRHAQCERQAKREMQAAERRQACTEVCPS